MQCLKDFFLHLFGMKMDKSCQNRQFPWREFSYWDNPGWIFFLSDFEFQPSFIAGMKIETNHPPCQNKRACFCGGRCMRYRLHHSDSPNAEPLHFRKQLSGEKFLAPNISSSTQLCRGFTAVLNLELCAKLVDLFSVLHQKWSFYSTNSPEEIWFAQQDFCQQTCK